jgi:hypothetical protein
VHAVAVIGRPIGFAAARHAMAARDFIVSRQPQEARTGAGSAIRGRGQFRRAGSRRRGLMLVGYP